MVKFDEKALENRIKTDLGAMLRAYVDEQVDIVRKTSKISEKSLFSAIETLTSNISLVEKQFNLKIGSIKGAQERKRSTNDDDVLATFDTFEDFEKWREAIEQKNQKLQTPESEIVDEFTPNDLLNK